MFRVAAALALTTLASSWLTGPFGPCGPSTALGAILVPAALLGGLASWALALAGFIQVALSSQRASLVLPSILAASITVLTAADTLKSLPPGSRPEPTTIARRQIVYYWPPLMALFTVGWSLTRARLRGGEGEAK